MQENTPVAVLQEYVRIRTDHPNPDYRNAVEFLKRQADRIGLPVVVYGTPSKPVVLMTWTGDNPSLKSVMFNSHMDVVPVVPEKWTFDPFAACKTEDGKIYGRGSQDMKSQGVEYIESVLKLKKEGFRPTRTIHLLFVPDEEIGGKEGMASFVKSSEFQSLNVGFAIDESCACPKDFCILFFDERAGWALEVTCTGPAGHGSLLPADTAADKARIVINEFLERREKERLKIADKPFPELELANVTTINLTMMEGGLQKNVIPDRLKLTFDIRVSVLEDHDEFANWIQSVITKAGEGVTVNFIDREKKLTPTKTDDSNPFWTALKSALDKTDIKVVPVACPGCTDARYLRGVGVPSFGFSPMRNTPVLLHGHDEYITEKVFLEGIEVFVEVMKSLSTVA
uniref:N-acyl-aliphatic-L-amino acid amidohydrolase n=1 Tax=Lygus hesperus TaxID=30085 RepID=A0A0A9Y4E8_LYGHE